MAKTDYASVDAYLEAQPETARPMLDVVRQAIRSALPEAQEVISYQIPAYRIAGRVALFFAGWKKHYSLYPVSDALLAAFADELEPYEVEKGTIRFPLSEPVPADLIGRIAAFKAEEAKARTPKRG
jgi:uncharacterized protein YdhG (YjbR/CyaY superfamily)